MTVLQSSIFTSSSFRAVSVLGTSEVHSDHCYGLVSLGSGQHMTV